MRWWSIREEELLDLLRQAGEGADPDLLLAELAANEAAHMASSFTVSLEAEGGPE